MKPNNIYFGKTEGLAQFPDYPIKLKLIRQIEAPYANKGDWIATSYFVPDYARKYEYVYVQELTQIWTVQQIISIFETEGN